MSTPGRKPEATIRSVAAAAGVSKSLVSLVLQNSPQVSATKRALVLAAIEELGYRPNAAARSLTQRRTRAVGLLMNDLRNPWFVEILEGLNSTLGGLGLSVLLGDGRLDRREDERLLHAFMDMRVEGLVLVGTMPESPAMIEAADRLPTVVVGTRDFDFPLADIAVQDDRRGVELAVQHLLDLGHQRIGHIAGNFGGVPALRRKSYEDTMTAAGLGAQIAVESSEMTEEGGYRAALVMLQGSDRPTAIVGVNDMVCLGALGAAHELGLRVPQDLSLIGYDNTHLAKLRYLSLTSVDISGRDVGGHAARLLLERIENPHRAPLRTWLHPPWRSDVDGAATGVGGAGRARCSPDGSLHEDLGTGS